MCIYVHTCKYVHIAYIYMYVRMCMCVLSMQPHPPFGDTSNVVPESTKGTVTLYRIKDIRMYRVHTYVYKHKVHVHL